MNNKVSLSRAILIILLLLTGVRGNAADVISGRILYSTNSSSSNATAYKILSDPPNYLSIASSITYNSKTYPVTSIGTYFGNYSSSDYSATYGASVTTLAIPYTIKTISSSFKNLISLKSFIVDEDNEYFTAVDGVLYNVDTTTIVRFPTAKNVDNFSIPNSVNSIRSYAFYGCTGLTDIEIPNSVNSIGSYAFAECTGLTSLVIPESVTELYWNLFDGCTLNPLVNKSQSLAAYRVGYVNQVYSGLNSSSVLYTRHDAMCHAKKQTSCTIYDIEAPDHIMTANITKFIRGIEFSLVTNPYQIGNGTFSRILAGNAEIKADEDGLYYVDCLDLSGNDWSYNDLYYVYKDSLGVEKVDTISITMPGLSSYSILSITDKTQTTLTVKATIPEDKTFSSSEVSRVKILCGSVSQEVEVKDGVATATFTGLKPSTEYTVYAYMVIDDEYYSAGSVDATTSSITWSLKNYATTASSFSCDLKYTLGDAIIDTVYTSLDSKGEVSIDIEGADLSITGLLPATSYTVYVYGTLTVGSTYSASYTFKTSDLELTTEQPKVLSSTSALISATTNVDESETNVGFEWRKTESPDEVASKSATAEIYDGELSGVIKNLSESTYYKYRAYYTSYIGTTYYGDWVGIDTDDYSYFEPTVKTGTASVDGTTVQVNGYALQGTDDITEQGFEYWTDDASSTIFTGTSVYSNVQTVVATGQKMSAELTDLAAYTTYNVRAYATTANGTTYGETIQFTTGEITGIGYVIADESESLTLYVRKNNGLEIAITGGNANECTYRVVSLIGSVVAQGKVDTSGTWTKVAEANALKGVYIVVATDGTSSESKKLFLK